MPQLTYDPTPADAPEFNEAEQEALAIGEKAEQEQQALLAGKFTDAEELEKAYIELQKKLGSNNESTSEDPVQLREEEEGTETSTEEVEVSPAAELISNASAEYAETGDISAELMEQFNSMSSADLVDAYVQMQSNLPTPVQEDLTESDVSSIKNSVGGEEAYNNLMSWANANMDPSDIEAFDNIVDTGDVRTIRLVTAGLKAEYESQNGYEGELVTGRASYETADVFRSQSEVVQAMSDPRYDRDPAYRNDVFEKLGRSNLDY